MYTVYILQSNKNGKYYVGHTSDLSKRLSEHNNGLTSSTKHGIPWEIVFQREFIEKGFAQYIELRIKKMKSRKFIQKLINDEISEEFFKRP